MTTETPPQTPFSFKDEIKTAWKVAAAKVCATVGFALLAGLYLSQSLASIGRMITGSPLSAYMAGSDLTMLAVTTGLALTFGRKVLRLTEEAQTNPEAFIASKNETTYQERDAHYTKRIKATLPPALIGFGVWGATLFAESLVSGTDTLSTFARGAISGLGRSSLALYLCAGLACGLSSFMKLANKNDHDEAALAPKMPDINTDEPEKTAPAAAEPTQETTSPSEATPVPPQNVEGKPIDPMKKRAEHEATCALLYEVACEKPALPTMQHKEIGAVSRKRRSAAPTAHQ